MFQHILFQIPFQCFQTTFFFVSNLSWIFSTYNFDFHYQFHVNFCLHRFLYFQFGNSKDVVFNVYFQTIYYLLFGVWNQTFLLTPRLHSESYLEFPALEPAKNFILSQIATLTDRIEELEAKIKINTNYERRLERLESRLGKDSKNYLDGLGSKLGLVYLVHRAVVQKLTIESR